jgi:hypothetical protein
MKWSILSLRNSFFCVSDQNPVPTTEFRRWIHQRIEPLGILWVGSDTDEKKFKQMLEEIALKNEYQSFTFATVKVEK